MLRFSFILIILILSGIGLPASSTPVISDQSQEQTLRLSQSVVSNETATGSPVDQITISNQVIEGQGYQSGRMTLDRGQSHTFSQLAYPNQLDLHFNHVYQDQLFYNTNFSELWGIGTGNFNQSFDNFRNEATISGTNLALESFFQLNTSILGIPIQQGSFLNVSLASLDTTFNDTVFGSFELQFIFDNMQIKLIYTATTAYLDTFPLVNSSSSIEFLVTEQWDQFLNLTTLVTEQNISKYPTSLNEIRLRSFYNGTYDLSTVFDQINLMQPVNNLHLAEPDKEIESMRDTVNLQADTDYIIKLLPDISVILSWERSHGISQSLTLVPWHQNQFIYANGSWEPEGEIAMDKYYYDLSQVFSNITSAESHNTTHLWYSPGSRSNYNLTGELLRKNNEIKTGEILQSYNYTISLHNQNYKHLYLYHQPSGQLRYQAFNNQVVIPANWSKGYVTVFLIQSTGIYISWLDELEFSPSKLISSRTHNFSRAQQYRIPIVIQNITSGIYTPANQVIIYHNSTVWDIVGKYGLLLDAGQFPVGTTILNVNATSSGLVPVIFDITLHIQKIELSPRISHQRETNHTTLYLEAPEVANWTINANLSITGSGIDTYHEGLQPITKVKLSHANWSDSESYDIEIKVVLEHELASFSFQYTIGPRDEGLPVGIILTLVSITGIGGTASVKLYRNKFGKETISF